MPVGTMFQTARQRRPEWMASEATPQEGSGSRPGEPTRLLPGTPSPVAGFLPSTAPAGGGTRTSGTSGSSGTGGGSRPTVNIVSGSGTDAFDRYSKFDPKAGVVDPMSDPMTRKAALTAFGNQFGDTVRGAEAASRAAGRAPGTAGAAGQMALSSAVGGALAEQARLGVLNEGRDFLTGVAQRDKDRELAFLDGLEGAESGRVGMYLDNKYQYDAMDRDTELQTKQLEIMKELGLGELEIARMDATSRKRMSDLITRAMSGSMEAANELLDMTPSADGLWDRRASDRRVRLQQFMRQLMGGSQQAGNTNTTYGGIG